MKRNLWCIQFSIHFDLKGSLYETFLFTKWPRKSELIEKLVERDMNVAEFALFASFLNKIPDQFWNYREDLNPLFGGKSWGTNDPNPGYVAINLLPVIDNS